MCGVCVVCAALLLELVIVQLVIACGGDWYLYVAAVLSAAAVNNMEKHF